LTLAPAVHCACPHAQPYAARSFWLALDWAGWVIVLAGISALQHKCHNSSNSIDDPDEWDPANFPIAGGGPPKGPTAALFPDISCV